jgi:hypothetical protein
MQIIVAEKFCILFITHSIVDKEQSFSILNQSTTQSPATHIVFISRIDPIPDRFWNDTKHGTSIQFEVTGVDRI